MINLKLRALFERYKHINFAVADQTLVSGVAFLTGLVLARSLGLDAFGMFSLLWMIVLLVCAIQVPLVISPMMTITPKKSGVEKRNYIVMAMSYQFYFSLVSSFLVLIGLLLWGELRNKPEIQGLALPTFWVVFFHQNQEFIRKYLFSINKPAYSLIQDTVKYFGQTSFILLALFFQEFDIYVALYLIATTSFFSILFSCVVFNDHFYLKSISFSKACGFSIINWNFSKWLLGTSVLHWVSGNIFTVAAAALLGTVAVGAIRAAQNIVGLLGVVFQALENAIGPKAASIYAANGIQSFNFYIRRLLLRGGGGTLVIACLLFISAEQVLVISYGNEFISASYLLKLLIIVYFLMFFNFVGGLYLKTIEVTAPILWAYVTPALFALIAADWLIQTYGINGVGYGGIIAQVVTLIIIYGFASFHSRSCLLNER
jgi:O-antigen/teichoic acid export membrane protein